MSSETGNGEFSPESSETSSPSVQEWTVPVVVEIDAHQMRAIEDTPRLRITEENIKELLERFGDECLTYKWTLDKTILHKCVEKSDASCVKLLFEAIMEKKEEVTLSWTTENGRTDILKEAIKNNALRLAENMMVVLMQELSKISDNWRWQVVKAVGRNFQQLLDHFPGRMEQLLMNDNLCFKLGRFYVPRCVFEAKNEEELAKTNGFYGSIEPKKEPCVIWTQRDGEESNESSNESSQEEVRAELKVLGVPVLEEDQTGNGYQPDVGNEFIRSLLAAFLSVEVFNCEAVRTMVNYHWYRDWNLKLYVACVLHFAATASFTIFAATFGLDSAGSNNGDLTTAKTAVVLNLVLIFITWMIRTQPWARGTSLLTSSYLLWHCFRVDYHTPFSAILTSIECLSTWTSVLWYLQFCSTEGPLVSLVRYVLWEVVIFALTTTLFLVGFGMILVLLYRNTFAESGKEHFDSPLRSFESLFYVLIGDFDPEVVRANSGKLVTIWITVLFSVFFFVGTIVLANLLISTINDAFGRMKRTEKAEVIKCRARIITGYRAPRLLVRFSEYLGKKMDWIPMPWAFLYKLSVVFSSLSLWSPSKIDKPVFYYLVPTDPLLQRETDVWEGCHKTVEKTLNENLSGVEERFSARLQQECAQRQALH